VSTHHLALPELKHTPSVTKPSSLTHIDQDGALSEQTEQEAACKKLQPVAQRHCRRLQHHEPLAPAMAV